MSDGYQYFDIILFAMVAAFLVLRLRSVLGRRTGSEKPPPENLMARFGLKPGTPATATDKTDNVVTLPQREAPAAEIIPPAPGGQAAAGIAQIRSVDPGFDAGHFLQGAKGAFEIIVGAFARGDTATLRPLLSDEVYDRFSEAIRHRLDAKETHETTLIAIKSAEIEAAELNGRTAFVTAKFQSDQVNVTRAADGTVIEGEPDHVVEKTDFWTFARNTRSQDPNWLLVATRSA
ncbi:MAG TPA: Tim44/TimA family putative adaptor protein [Stellaceae bacterium]|nr:Tim44/TimA family putative adaptor protein [Stellaceae bacterium]